jgi:mannose-1-phosphate guanylyltransferase
MVAEQLRQIGAKNANILLAPVGRNTVPTIVLAALNAKQNEEDPPLLVLAAYHYIETRKPLKVINAIKSDGWHEHTNHRKVYRPSGFMRTLNGRSE